MASILKFLYLLRSACDLFRLNLYSGICIKYAEISRLITGSNSYIIINSCFQGFEIILTMSKKDRDLFRQLTVKLAGPSKGEQVAFLLSQAKKISSKSDVVKASLSLVSPPPDFKHLTKEKKRPYRSIYSLIDKILPLAAGSAEPQSQLKLLEARWKHVHKQPLMPYTMDFKTLLSSIDQLTWTVIEDDNKLIQKQSHEVTLFRRLLTKLLGDNKQKQLTFLKAFLLRQADTMSSKLDLVTASLNAINTPPDFMQIKKVNRRAYRGTYSLIDKILPLATGSNEPQSQLKLLEAR